MISVILGQTKRESGNNTDRSRFIQKIQMENVWTSGKRMDGGVLEFWMKKAIL